MFRLVAIDLPQSALKSIDANEPPSAPSSYVMEPALLSRSEDSAEHLRFVMHKMPLQQFHEHSGAVIAAEWMPPGNQVRAFFAGSLSVRQHMRLTDAKVASSSLDNTLRLFDVETASLVTQTLPGNDC
jgi:hypothetical protein